MFSLAVTTILIASKSLAVRQHGVLFKNGNIYTLSARQPHAEAIYTLEGRIYFVGSNRAARAFETRGAKVIDLHGATVVPGLTDSHFHLPGVGEREMNLNLEGTSSLAQFLTKVKERVDRSKPGEWVTGRGWIETFWKPQAFPSRAVLDSISPNNPVYLRRADGHGAIANSAALKVAGITKDTPSPFGGEVMKDKTTGEPTGMLLDNANGLISRFVPPPSAEDEEKAVLLGAKFALEKGLCEVQVAGGSWADVDRLKTLYGSGRLKLRIYQALYSPAAPKLLTEGAILGQYDNRLTVRTIKLIADGALGSKGAALLQPYHDYNTSGFMTITEAQTMPILTRALVKGIQVETHAIGDRANRSVLDWYEKALASVPPQKRRIREPRWRIEHAQNVQPSDVLRFAKLGIIPSMQPSHAIGDLHFAKSRLGLDRLANAYSWQSFLKAGCIIAGGSDAPVERGDPMIEFYAATARRDLKGYSGEGWHLEQAVSREHALKMLTLWPARAAFEEHLKGSLEVGKLADMTVLSADIMKIPLASIPKTKCVMTIVGGEIVFKR